jgi:tRNA pseudouridine32 synthase/23S rRNA pseudouridine746 synthase
MITYFDPQPRADELPARFPSPFAVPPHPLAARAVVELVRELPALHEGKMFGALVVAASDGRIGYLRGFSGMLNGSWHAPGFVPPLFDEVRRDAFWPAGEAELGALAARLTELERDAVHGELARLQARHDGELVALRRTHAERRSARQAARTQAGGRALHALDQESRGDSAERRRLVATHAAELATIAPRAAELVAERDQVDQRRAERSRALWRQLQDTYVLANARGEHRSMHELWEGEPPGGAGDCAAPKLLGHAYRTGLRPVALAEVWCGPPPEGGGRVAGICYPACRGKCGPLLPHMLDGLDAEAAPVFGADAIRPDEPRIVFEDAWLAVVAKPVGLLSVPGRSGQLRDSVLVRLRGRYPGAAVVHRLDLDTSGLLLVAKDDATYAALQRAFALRQIEKRYLAIVDGDVPGAAGTIELPLRVDLDDRPRQIVDHVHGKAAVTTWRVLSRANGRTRLALIPHTGRTHQLRVHCAHERGLASPIVGDRLYGRSSARLMLHAEALAFAHPHSGERITLEIPAPF